MTAMNSLIATVSWVVIVALVAYALGLPWFIALPVGLGCAAAYWWAERNRHGD